MSTQTADAPDWFQGGQWQNPAPFVQEINVTQPGVATYGPFEVMHWESLLIQLVSNNRVFGGIAWSTDAAGANVVGQQSFAAEAGVSYVDVLPVIAPFVTLSITWFVGVGSATETFFLSPALGSDPWKKPVGDLTLIGNSGQLIAGGGTTFNQLALFVTTGRAVLACGTDSTNWFASLFPLSTAGTQAGQLALIGTSIPGPASMAAVTLPAASCKLSVVNNDAGARTFRFSLVLSR